MCIRLIFVLVSVLMVITTANCANVVNPAPTLIRIQPQTEKTEISPLIRTWIRDGQYLEQVRKPREYHINQIQKGKKAQDLRNFATRYFRTLDGLRKEIQDVTKRLVEGKGHGQGNQNQIRGQRQVDQCSYNKIGSDNVQRRARSYYKKVPQNKQPGQAAPASDALPAGLNSVYPAQFPAEIVAISLLSVQDKLSLSEQGLLTSAFIAGRAAGLPNLEATLFAVRNVNTELELQSRGLEGNISLADLALAFKTAIAIAISRGMSEADATNFASPMIVVEALSGLQSADLIAMFADTFKRALEIGKLEGMDISQRTEFGSAVVPIQRIFGVQSDATLVTFAQSFISIFNVGVELGMSQGDALRFTWVMLQIQARLGTLSVDRVRQDGQEYLAGIADAILRGESATMARISTLTAIVVQSGVNSLRGSTPTLTQVKVKGTRGHGHGSLIDVTDVGLLNNLGKGVLSDLQLLTGGSTINEESGGLFGGILKGRAHHEGPHGQGSLSTGTSRIQRYAPRNFFIKQG